MRDRIPYQSLAIELYSVIARLACPPTVWRDRTIQNLYKRLDSPIKSGNDILHFGY